MVDMRNGGHVPREARQGACEETAPVIDEMGDDHFNDVLRKPVENGWGCRGNVLESTTRTVSPECS